MVDVTKSPLTPLIDQIMLAANHGLDLVAIGMAVALPAICASLENSNGRSGGTEYKAWCAANLNGPEFSYVTEEDLYSMRCGILHQGRYGELKHNVSRVLFVPRSQVSFANCLSGDAYIYSVDYFCKNICKAAQSWYESNKYNPIVIENVNRMMQYYPSGISPYFHGLVIA